MDADSTPVQQHSSRKHLRNSDEDNESDLSSDVSGRFDDAEELVIELDSCNSPSAKSSKRRRSSDWPLPDEAADYGHHDRRNVQKMGNPTISYRASPKASPRISVASFRNRHKAASSTSPRSRLGRRSRFVEATMSDSVSEKPPSIFFREGKGNGQNRGSGIFRFGKTIAAAFNPFGVWGKHPPEHAAKPESETDALTQAEAAYAELKKAGFKGTNKGAYTQKQRVDPAIADETWQAIADKMGMNTAIGNPMPKSNDQNNHITSPRAASKAHKHSSHDFFLSSPPSLPFIKHESTVPSTYPYPEQSQDFENNIVRRQKSRKELTRQAKLLKKVSNLEDKLERARRELRTLAGNEVTLPPVSKETKHVDLEMDPVVYPRKFVPGALPSLPSERLLDQQDILADMPQFDVEQHTAFTPMQEGSACLEENQSAYSTKVVTKSPRRRESRPSILGKESSSLKRKSPDPEPVASRKPHQPIPTGHLDEQPNELEQLIDAGLLSPSRQAKWQKSDAGDSPGTVERTRSENQDGTPTKMYTQSCLSSPNQTRPSTVRSPLLVRTSRGSFDLRSISIDSIPDPISNDLVFSPSPPPIETHQAFYFQQHSQLDPGRTAHSNFSPSQTRGSKYDEEVPPVPPLPKELPTAAFKENKLPKKKASGRKATALSPQNSSVQNQHQAQQPAFLWPEDCF
ncbi:hypothetical protein N7495_006631 [Penicillium taxi]|uniref:uncharacterized protein n=1 Tax=Penicillium taxi TaxID=168475 RepID=UPI0025453652|nr:uncharacterized protein N7495_006631 [Penicillium taxi]KAJ5894940.1 hypothetical protein N7495_006631 [Penicillium taxi]